jgi:hypothetical protein
MTQLVGNAVRELKYFVKILKVSCHLMLVHRGLQQRLVVLHLVQAHLVNKKTYISLHQKRITIHYYKITKKFLLYHFLMTAPYHLVEIIRCREVLPR